MSSGEVRRWISGAAVAALLLWGTTSAAAGQWMEMVTARGAEDERLLEVEVEYGAGQLSVSPAEEGLLYRARLRYESSIFEPLRSFRRSDGAARLLVGLRSTGQAETGISVDLRPWRFKIDLGGLERLGDEAGMLELGLGRSVPVSLRVKSGASESELQLGGIPLRSVTIETGASETRLEFDRPNPAEMEELILKAGVADFRAEGLGNARFRTLEFRGGVGDVVLDFDGRWDRDATARVSMGLGSLTLRVPSELGVRLEKSSVLSSFTAVGFVSTEDGYRTENWERAEHRLELSVDSVFGSIEVEVVP